MDRTLLMSAGISCFRMARACVMNVCNVCVSRMCVMYLGINEVINEARESLAKSLYLAANKTSHDQLLLPPGCYG